MTQLTRHLLLWSQTRCKSLPAIHIPGELNRAANVLSRQLTFPGEWRLHPEMIWLIWSRFGEAQVDLFASHESCCMTPWPRPPWYRHTGTQLASGFMQVCIPQWAFPHRHCARSGRTKNRSCWFVPYWPIRTWFSELMLLVTAPPWRMPLSKGLLSQRLGTIGTCVQIMGRGIPRWSPTGGGRHDHSGQSPLFEASFCLGVESVRDLVFFTPRRPLKMHDWSSAFFPARKVGACRLSPSTLKVYVAAIAAHHDAVDSRSLGKHNLIVRFLRDAKRLKRHETPSFSTG